MYAVCSILLDPILFYYGDVMSQSYYCENVTWNFVQWNVGMYVAYWVIHRPT